MASVAQKCCCGCSRCLSTLHCTNCTSLKTPKRWLLTLTGIAFDYPCTDCPDDTSHSHQGGGTSLDGRYILGQLRDGCTWLYDGNVFVSYLLKEPGCGAVDFDLDMRCTIGMIQNATSRLFSITIGGYQLFSYSESVTDCCAPMSGNNQLTAYSCAAIDNSGVGCISGSFTLTPCVDLAIVSVTATCSNTVIIQFDSAFVFNDTGTMLAFNVNGHLLTTGTGVQTSPTTVEIDVSGYTPVAGDTWTVTDQLEWTSGVPNLFPANGLVLVGAC